MQVKQNCAGYLISLDYVNVNKFKCHFLLERESFLFYFLIVLFHTYIVHLLIFYSIFFAALCLRDYVAPDHLTVKF